VLPAAGRISLDILIVEDEAIVAMVYRQSLRELGDIDVEFAFSAEEALAAVERSLPKLILLDIKLRGKRDGVEVAESIRLRHEVPIVFITAFSDPETLRRAWRTRPACILGKSGDDRELVRIAARFMQAGPGEKKKYIYHV
jgi:CheY-like chemotaxis protein